MEWFKLDPESFKADSEQKEQSEVKTTERAPKAKAVTLTPAPKEEKKPNKPLNFRLENLDRSHPYLTEERGLDKKTILDFGVGYFTGKKGIMVNRIVIPIHNAKGELVAYAGRWPGEPPDKETEKYKLPPGFWKTLELFNIDRAIKESGDKPLIIVEGFFGCMRIHQLGYRKVIALMGSTIDDAQVELIRRHTNSESRIIIVFDEDEAGRDGRADVAARLSEFCFVKTHAFEQEDMQADQLSAEELHEILGGGM
jgi:5S rRNA maturation endonuclease (ribonuclease M5)